MKQFYLPVIVIVVTLILLHACNKNDNAVTPPTSSKITIGQTIDASSVTITPSGGTVTVNVSDSTIKGMQIIVPPNSYSDNRTFKVSYATITSHLFGQDFIPISPLITISNGGGYADSLMLVKIPIKLLADHFAMGFYYNNQTGELEGIPVVSLTDTTIHIVTRHFSADALGFAKSIFGESAQNPVQLVIAAVRKDKLMGTFTTDFHPGQDDWEFTNYGSYLSPAGHCAGQSIATIWYYSAKKMKESAASLYNRFDNVHTTEMWMDNPYGYRFCSVIQDEVNWENRANWLKQYENIGTQYFNHDDLVFLSFAYGIKMTRKPQLVEIWRIDDQGKGRGHAMIVYGVSNQGNDGTLMIADPNYPGEVRTMPYWIGTLGPYVSSSKKGQTPREYKEIHFIGKSSTISFEGLAARWKQLEDKTIGTIGPNQFPQTTLFWFDDKQKILPVTDQIVTTSDWITLFAECPTCGVVFNGKKTYVKLTDENGKFISWNEMNFGNLLIENLKLGTQRFGLTIYGQPDQYSDTSYIDFKWLNIKREGDNTPKITLAPYVFSVEMNNATGSDGSVRYSRKIGTITFSIDITWNNPPTGTVSVKNNSLFWTLDMKFTLKESETTGHNFFKGCDLWINALDGTNDWYHSKTDIYSFSLVSQSVNQNIPSSSTKNEVNYTAFIPVTMKDVAEGGGAHLKGMISISGSIDHWLPGGESIPFTLKYSYPE